MKNHFNLGNVKENKIAFTFDDGPNPHATLKIMDILEKYNIKGTFFVLGKNVEKYPEIIKEIEKRGHTIGNHTYSHRVGDFKKADGILKSILDKDIDYVRPPYYDLSFCDLEYDWVSSKKVITGDVDSFDYEDIDYKKVIDSVISKVKNGSIICFHDGSDIEEETSYRPNKTIKALPFIIEHLQSSYEIVSIDDMDLILD